MYETVKIFEEPIKTTGYLRDLDLEELLGFLFDGYMIIKQKYKHEDDYELCIEKLDYDYHRDVWLWENDWYEGQDDVLLLGYFSDFCGWSDKEQMRFIDFLKEYKE